MPGYSYASTSRTVSRIARRAGKALATRAITSARPEPQQESQRRERVRERGAEEEVSHRIAESATDEQAERCGDGGADGGHDQPFDQHELRDVAVACADGSQHADLALTLEHVDAQHPGEPEPADDGQQHGHHHEERGDGPEVLAVEALAARRSSVTDVTAKPSRCEPIGQRPRDLVL